MFGRIRSEYESCRNVLLCISGQEEFLDCDPTLQRSLPLRNPYVEPLSYIQVSLIRRIRALQGQSGPDAEAAVAALRESLHLTLPCGPREKASPGQVFRRGPGVCHHRLRAQFE